MLEWLEQWYESQCDGDWEHTFGIHIETIDNPGWSISIDLEDTAINLEPKKWQIFGEFDDRWLGFQVVDRKFDGCCDPKNLGTLISVFKKLVEDIEIDSKEILLGLKN